MSRKLIMIIACLWCASLFAGCGYTTRSSVKQEVLNIYVEPFRNEIDFTAEDNEYRKLRTYFPLLEVDITNNVVDEFISDGNFRISKQDDADVILQGALLGYQRDALRHTDDEDVEEYRINLIVRLVLWNVAKSEPEWEEAGFVGDTTYYTSGSLAKSESTAVQDAVNDLAKRIVERAADDW
ncbi:LPS assembly lipoprotein LptE [Candidatus Omnitrophota bacterium]